MVLGGWFIDRLGPWRMLVAMGLGSALFGALTGGLGYGLVGASNLVACLVVVRGLIGLMGLCTTPVHPGCARAVSIWLPAQQVSRANGLVTFAAMMGMASVYPLFGGLMDWIGWPPALLVVSGGLVAVTVLCAMLGRDHSMDRRRTNDAERVDLSESAGEAGPSMATRNTVLLTLGYAVDSWRRS